MAVQARLLAPGGCPWDREQTHDTLRPYLIEEAYEVLDALDSGDPAHIAEELGDLLLQVVFHAQLGAQAGRFDICDVVRHIHDKLVRRHPHVFGRREGRDAGGRAQELGGVEGRREAGGSRQEGGRRRQVERSPSRCSTACRGRCRPCSRATSYRRRLPKSALTGRQRRTFSTSWARKRPSCGGCWNRTPARHAASVRGNNVAERRRAWRPAFRLREPGAVHGPGCRDCAEESQSEILRGAFERWSGWRLRAGMQLSRRFRAMQLEALWAEAKERG